MAILSLFIGILVAVNYVACYPTLPSEPTLPKTVCTTLNAELTSSGGTLPTSDDSKADTTRLQSALNACASGQAVKLVTSGANNAFLSAPLTLPSGVTLWVDKGVTLFASRNPADYHSTSAKTCGTVGDLETGCHALITATNTKKSGVVGEGTIDGRGGSPLTGKTASWWDNTAEAKGKSKASANPQMIAIDGGSDFLLYKITIHNAPKWQVVPTGVNGFIAWGVKIQTPTSAYPNGSAGNTDGINPNGSQDVVIAYCQINTGDDNIAIKAINGESKNILVAHNHFYKGHGMSIGSELYGHNVNNVLVTNLTIDGADNGLRIKSAADRGAKVSDIRYENVCIRNVNNPLEFNAFYTTNTGTLYPDFQGITLSNVHILSSSKKTMMMRGYSDKYPLKITLDNVQSDVVLTATQSHAEITEGPGEVKNLGIKASTADGVTITGTTKTTAALDCANVFVAFGA